MVRKPFWPCLLGVECLVAVLPQDAGRILSLTRRERD